MSCEESGATQVVGEDLGTVPHYVRPSLRTLGIAGFKIPQWETQPDGNVIPGHAYERLSVATFATHDHFPLRAMWQRALEDGEQSHQARQDLAKIGAFSGLMPNDSMDYLRDFYPAIFDALFRCESWIAIVMITDLLGKNGALQRSRYRDEFQLDAQITHHHCKAWAWDNTATTTAHDPAIDRKEWTIVFLRNRS